MSTEKQQTAGGTATEWENGCAAPFPMAENTVEELVTACLHSPGWSPTGITSDERFALLGYKHDWTLFFSLGHGEEVFGDHVSEVRSLTLTAVGRQNASVGMNWGEATELINAMTLIVDAAMWHAGILPGAADATDRQAPFRVSGTTVSELVEFCEESGSWMRAGQWRNGVFVLDVRRTGDDAEGHDDGYRIALAGGYARP